MKKIFASAIILLLSLLLISSNSQPFKNQIVAFGAVRYESERISGVSVNVVHDDQIIDRMVTGRVGAYGFSLQFNEEYDIVFAKEGYIKQSIHIDTHVPEDVISYGADILWEPDFYIYKIMPGFTLDEFNIPVASYVFDADYWGFIEDKEYKAKAESFLNNIEQDLNVLKEKACQNEIGLADSLFNTQNYEEAIIAYNSALQYNNDDSYVNSRIKSAKKLLKKQYSIEEGYQQALHRADEFIMKGDLEMANAYYQKALIYKPKETYPLNKLYEIDSIRSYSWIQNTTQFEEYVQRADSLFLAANHKEAKESYSNALAIFPRRMYPQQMMHKIDSITRAEQHKEIVMANNNAAATDKPGTVNAEYIVPEPAQLPDKDTARKPASRHETVQSADETEKNLTTLDEITEVKKGSENETRIDESDAVSDTFQGLVSDGEETKENLQRLRQALEEKMHAGDKQGSSEILAEIGMVYQNDFELGKALDSYNRSLTIKREIGDKNGEAEVLGNIASVMYDSGSYTTAIQTFEQSLAISKEINNPVQSLEILSNLATVYESTYRYDEAIESLNRSLKITQQSGNQEESSELYKRIGNIYYEQNNYEKAITELEKSYTIDAQLQHEEEMASGLNNMGAVYYGMNQYDRAIEYFERSLNLTRKTNNQRIEAITLNNIGNINFDSRRFNKAIEYYEKSLKIKTDLSLTAGMAATLHNIGNSYYELKHYIKALEYYTSSQQVAQEVNYKEVIWKNLEAFAKTYAALGKYKEAFENYREYTNFKYEFMGQSMQFVELREQYESSKIAVRTLKRELQKQNRLARLEAERNQREMQIIQLEMDNKMQQIKRNRIIIISFIIGSLTILVFSLIITKQYRLTRKAYKLVAEQKKHITDGISYAARIQRAVLPPEKYTQRVLPEYFVLNKPREVVGGDFYWVATHYNRTVVAVSDCTGHGVPGGFMSMLGIAILNEIISIERPLESHEILTLLRNRVVEALHQKHRLSESLDGMDISLIILDPDKKEIQFSAAYHSLYLIRNGELEKIKGDRVPIGYHRLTRPFTSQTIHLQEGDMIYLTTDGFIDQIGQKTKDRFMLSNFKDELLAIYKKPLREQEAHLEKVLSDWKGKVDQTDDILVMGLRF